VQVIRGDVLATFADAITRTRPPLRRVMIVSPWVSEAAGGGLLGLITRRVLADQAALILITRPYSNEAHVSVIEAIRALPRGSVFTNPALHAKVYLCEQGGGRGFAVIGSANMTSGSARLVESAVLIRPLARSRIIAQIAAAASGVARSRRSSHGPGRRCTGIRRRLA
jgi:hypothetical protein